MAPLSPCPHQCRDVPFLPRWAAAGQVPGHTLSHSEQCTGITYHRADSDMGWDYALHHVSDKRDRGGCMVCSLGVIFGR